MVSDEEARAAAREILADGKFTRWHEDFDAWLRAFEGLLALLPDWLIEGASWVLEMLKMVLLAFLDILGWLLGFFGFIDTPHALVGWVGAALLVAIACVLAYRVAGDRFSNGRERTPHEPAPVGHADAIREATALASRGRFLEAAHRVQLATLSFLIERGWIELARSDPNRTLRQRVAASSLPQDARGDLIALVDRLEALWFDAPVEDRALYEAWLALDTRILRFGRGRNP